jgi:hypothetical protein
MMAAKIVRREVRVSKPGIVIGVPIIAYKRAERFSKSFGSAPKRAAPQKWGAAGKMKNEKGIKERNFYLSFN